MPGLCVCKVDVTKGKGVYCLKCGEARCCEQCKKGKLRGFHCGGCELWLCAKCYENTGCAGCGQTGELGLHWQVERWLTRQGATVKGYQSAVHGE